MELQNDLYVISATHWDREWRFAYEKTRMLLVDMMDALLEVLEGDPEFKHFHLDGQTIPLEDYCEVRPENEPRLRRLIESGRLLIGPWFVLPEENQMSGESLVRNFLWGERVGRRFGGNMKVGYTPTSWGQVSQMPQIMRGFGVDSIIFYRGISSAQVPGNYYFWDGPDGSRIFGIRLGDYARSSFFHLVDRPVVFNRGRANQSPDWSSGGKPFRLCGSGSESPYNYFRPPMGWHPERLREAFENLEASDLGQWETPFALAMESQDSIGAFALTPRIIREAQALVTNGKRIVHANLPDFVREAREQLDADKLVVMQGEMRHPLRKGVWTDLYAEVQACRIPLKVANRRAEWALQRIAEPLATIAWQLGAPYPRFLLDRAYRLLLQSQAHDSIGGCGRDIVHEEVAFRLAKVMSLAQLLTDNAAREIVGRLDTAAFAPDTILLVVTNPAPRPWSGVADAEVDLERTAQAAGLRVVTAAGAEAVDVQVLEKQKCLAAFNHPQELPLRMDAERWHIRFWAEQVPALGCRVYVVQPTTAQDRTGRTLRTGPAAMENEYLAVRVNPNGTVDVTCKATGQTLRNQNAFEDRGDVGDYWIGAFPTNDCVINSLGCAARLAVLEDGPLSVSLEASLALDLPIRAKQDASAREQETRPVAVRTVYRLDRGEQFLRITTTVDNTVEDHILRARFPTGIATDRVHAETAFDVVERAIPLPDTRGWREPYKPVQPHQNFVDVSDGRRGVALLNRGLPQYEAVDDPDRTLALTLLRAHRAWNSVRLAFYPDQHGTQLQGRHTFTYALFPHAGDWRTGGVLPASERLNMPPLVGATGPGAGDLPMDFSFLRLEGEGLVLNAMKQGEWDDSLVLRISNPSRATIDGSLRFRQPPARLELVNMMESIVQGELVPDADGRVALAVKAGAVLTLRVWPAKA